MEEIGVAAKAAHRNKNKRNILGEAGRLYPSQHPIFQAKIAVGAGGRDQVCFDYSRFASPMVRTAPTFLSPIGPGRETRLQKLASLLHNKNGHVQRHSMRPKNGCSFRKRSSALAWRTHATARKPASDTARKKGRTNRQNPDPALQAGTQVFGTGHTAAHWGSSKLPLHSWHLAGSMTNISFFSEMAEFGHSSSQAPHTVHFDATIL
jgi:hypothetical protein